MNLDVNNWKTFRYDEIFDIKKGFYNKKPEPSGTGNIPFLGATDKNNGVTEYYTIEEIDSASKTGDPPNAPLEQKIFPGHAVCVTNNGSVGYAYYHDKEFTCSHDVNPLYLLDGEFNYYTGLFVASVIMFDRYRWGYGRKWRPTRMKYSKIKLPANSKGKPDLDFMEKYIKTLHCERISTSISNSDVIIQTDEWKPFLLHRLFIADMGNGIDAIATTEDEPVFNYVSRNSNGNGVVGFVDRIPGEEPFPAGAMSLALGGSYLGSCFIQNKPFYTAQNVAVLKEKLPLSDHTKLFIATLIRNECKIKYQAFGRELNAHFRKDFTVKLPVKKDENGYIIDETKEFSDDGYIPDWDWMDSFMKSLPYGDRI